MFSLICHRLSERSIIIDGNYLPVCARCTGIYTGVFISCIYVFVKSRFAKFNALSVKGALFACFMAPMYLDGVTSYLMIRQTTNLIRITTGAAFGAAFPALFLIAYNFSFNGRNDGVLLPISDFAAIVLLAELFAVCVYNGIIFNWITVTVCIATGFFAVLLGLALLMMKRIFGLNMADAGGKT